LSNKSKLLPSNKQNFGRDSRDITIFYDQAADGNWDGIANWEAAPFNEWQEISTSFTVADVPMYRAVVNNWNDFSDIPYALYKSSVIITFNDFGPFVLVLQISLYQQHQMKESREPGRRLL
jgi:hypothetical protein